MLTHFSLFSGIGGIDLSAEWAGFQTVGQCEFADYPYKVLEKHWPDVPKWRDVRNVTAESIRERGIGEITLLSGGFPCQPHSVAGKREGSLDERDLWPEFRRVIGETSPRWVLGENVPGIFTSDNRRFFGAILADLAALGYSVGWCTYGANAVGAPHERERVGIMAYARCKHGDKGAPVPKGYGKQEPPLHSERRSEVVFWADGIRPRDTRAINGIPNRLDRLKCLGNAVVPAQFYPILQAIADIERSTA